PVPQLPADLLDRPDRPLLVPRALLRVGGPLRERPRHGEDVLPGLLGVPGGDPGGARPDQALAEERAHPPSAAPRAAAHGPGRPAGRGLARAGAGLVSPAVPRARGGSRCRLPYGSCTWSETAAPPRPRAPASKRKGCPARTPRPCSTPPSAGR